MRTDTFIANQSTSHRIALTSTFIMLISFMSHGIASELSDKIKRCTKHQTAMKRLACFDEIAEKHKLVAKKKYVSPPDAFLNSTLTVTPWHAEYKLTVQNFVGLIMSAVMEDGKKIVVHGWTKEGHDYVLNITMRRPLRLKFLPFETATDEIPLSLFRKLIIDGEATDAGLFVTTIASMVPDKKP